MNRHNRLFSLVISLLIIITIMPIHSISQDFQNEIISLPSFDKKILSDNDIPELLDRKSIKANGHVSRLKFAEDDLSTAVFENADGTRTMYIHSEPIKYETEDGQIFDKSLSIAATKEGYAVEHTDVKLYFGKTTTDGVTIKTKEHLIKMSPFSYGSRKPSLTKDNQVVYQNVFDDGVNLRYTPQSQGVKEDIIIDNYNGIDRFSFIIETNGLALIEDENNIISFVDIKTGDYKFQFDDITIYDSKNKTSKGRYSHKVIEENQKYELSLNIDHEYLKSASYPVIVDPSLFGWAGNTKNFLDRTIYSDGSLTNGGYLTQNSMGYISSGKYAMTLIKIPGLYNGALYKFNKDAITSISLSLYCPSLGSSVTAIKAYAFTGGDWDESVNPTSVSQSSTYTSTGSKISSNTPYNYRFDLQTILNGWKSGAISPTKGLLINTTNYTNSNSHAKIYAVDANNTYRPSLAITYNVGRNDKIEEDVSYMIVSRDYYGKSMQVNADNKCVQYTTSYKTQTNNYFNSQLFRFEYWNVGLYYIKTIDGKKLTYASTGNHPMTFSTSNNRDYQLWYVVNANVMGTECVQLVPFLYVGKSLSTGGSSANSYQLIANTSTNDFTNYWHLRVCLDVPLHAQAHWNTCGTADALMALEYLNAISPNSNRLGLEWNFAVKMTDHIPGATANSISHNYDYTPPQLLILDDSQIVTTVSNVTHTMKSYLSASGAGFTYNHISLGQIAGSGSTPVEKFAACIEKNIKDGYPVIAQAKIDDTAYFNYTSSGHYLLIVGYYDVAGTKMVIINDSHYDTNKGKQLVVSVDKLYHYVKEHSKFIIGVYNDGL